VALERLSLESVSEHTLIACEHVHRYEFAASLCEGLRVVDLACGVGYGSEILAQVATAVHGVDIDVAAIDSAAATVGKRSAATFGVADASDFLSQDLTGDYDMLVCFEGLEHFDGFSDVVDLLANQVRAGVKLVCSVPNSKMFEEENEFHVSSLGHRDVLELAERLSASVVWQYLSEGSLIYVDGTDELEASLINLEQAEPEYANHFILLSNLEDKEAKKACKSRMQLSHGPVYNRYIRSIEIANRELHRRNNELARKMLTGNPMTPAKADAAAATFTARLSGRLTELEAQIKHQNGEIDWRDDMIIAQRREILALRQQILRQPGVDQSADRSG
jgi:2-polyprenyl-3-methyl-5-hydroxy-6-metoxy-1,4-benzoquinol methylase